MKNSTKRSALQPHLPTRRAVAALSILTLLLGACVYRIPIQQGNYLDPAAVAQIKTGMTRSQVRYLLGTPMVPGGFDNSRWDYDYYLKTRRLQAPARAHVVVHFENDLVARVESNVKAPPTTVTTSTGPSTPSTPAPAEPTVSVPEPQ